MHRHVWTPLPPPKSGYVCACGVLGYAKPSGNMFKRRLPGPPDIKPYRCQRRRGQPSVGCPNEATYDAGEKKYCASCTDDVVDRKRSVNWK